MVWKESLDTETVRGTDRWMRRLARGLASGELEADDASQETWVAALTRPPADDLPREWLARVLTNFVRRGRRETYRRARRERWVSRPEGDTTTPADSFERDEMRRQLLRAVAELREPYRSTIRLRFFEELRLRQIASMQGISVNTVKSRVRRGLRQMRRRMSGTRDGREACWTILLSLLAAGRPASAVPPRGPTILKTIGVTAMGSKSLLAAACISLVLVLGLGLTLQRAARSEPATGGKRGDDLVAANVANGAGELPSDAPRADRMEASPRRPLGANAPATTETLAPDPEEEPAASLAAGVERNGTLTVSAETAAMRDTWEALRKAFGEGGADGWKRVAEEIAAAQDLLMTSDDGFAEFLALIDGETDGSFLEALMHHLPMARTESREAVLADEELHEAIWDRFEVEEDPTRRMALLRFFAFNRDLNSSRMDTFLEVATTDPAAEVRQLSVDAIASNRPLLAETWETLADVAENDPSGECRRTAISGLALVDSDRATSLVAAAFTSEDEAMRAAALLSKAGDDLPITLTGGDATSYLVAEFRAASSRRYKKALLERLLERSPEVLEAEIRRALPDETNWLVKKDYRATLERLRARNAPGNEASPESQ